MDEAAALLFTPESRITRTPSDENLRFAPLAFTTPDGSRLQGWHIASTSPKRKGLILHLNGSARNRQARMERSRAYSRHGFDSVLFDYRSFGDSQGILHSENNFYEDARTVAEFLRKQLASDACPLIYWGESLGSVIASALSATHPPQALLLESVFLNYQTLLKDLLEADLPGLNEAIRTRFRFDMTQWAPHIMAPALLIHGNLDANIDDDQKSRVFDLLPGIKKRLLIDKAGHDDLYRFDPSRYWEEAFAFIHEHIRPV